MNNDYNQEKAGQLYNGLSKEQQEQVQKILSDKSQTEKILNSPQAKALLKKLMGEK